MHLTFFGEVCFLLLRFVQLRRFRGLQSGSSKISMGGSRGRFSEEPGASRRRHHGKQETRLGVPPSGYGGAIAGMTDEEAAKHSPIVHEHDGVFTRQRRIGRRVRCREVEASGARAGCAHAVGGLGIRPFASAAGVGAAGFQIWTRSRRWFATAFLGATGRKAGANALLAVRCYLKNKPLARLPRMESLQRSRRMTKKREMHPVTVEISTLHRLTGR